MPKFYTLDRKAIRVGGSMDVSSCGPRGYEDPAGSIIVNGDVNSPRRKGKGSSAMFVSRGLVGPKPVRKSRLVNRETG